jgi:acyl carrier protein
MDDNNSKLKYLIVEVLLIDDGEYINNSGPDEIDTWDSLATVNLATRIGEEFGLEVTAEEFTDWLCIGDIKACLRDKGLSLT